MPREVPDEKGVFVVARRQLLFVSPQKSLKAQQSLHAEVLLAVWVAVKWRLGSKGARSSGKEQRKLI